jgi:hypothetical protein
MQVFLNDDEHILYKFVGRRLCRLLHGIREYFSFKENGKGQRREAVGLR